MQREGYVTTPDGIRLYVQSIGEGPQIVVFPNGMYLLDDFKRLADRRTLVFYDLRNRGRSDHVGDASKLERGVHHDVDDLETVRRHFGIDALEVLGHSYVGLMVVLYALKYETRVNRIVQLAPMEPHYGKQYPEHLTGVDDTLREFFAKAAELQKTRQEVEPEEFCRRFWSILRPIYVVNPADAEKIKWGRCELPNERALLKYWSERVLPTIKRLDLAPALLSSIRAPVLIVHGRKDRSAPYGGAREWALLLPNARLVTVADAAHAPWIESPEQVFDAVTTFFDGGWPAAAERVESLDPRNSRG